MKYIAIDLGLKRIGLAYSAHKDIATPLPAVQRKNRDQASCEVKKVIDAWEVDAVVIGIDPSCLTPAAGHGDRRLSSMDGIEMRIAPSVHRNGLGKSSRDALPAFFVHDPSLLPRAKSGQRVANGVSLKSLCEHRLRSPDKRLPLVWANSS